MTAAAELQSQSDAIAMLLTWGLTCEYTPKSGAARMIQAVVDEDGAFPDSQSGITSQEEITVFVLRDKDNETYGGIDAPQIGDGLRLDRDEPNKVYAWTCEKSQSDRYSWTLKFRRNIPYEVGGSRR